MVGVPYQTVEHQAEDLLFLRDFGADMVGCVLSFFLFFFFIFYFF